MGCAAYQGVILDLDGVITRTARLHARAWQQMFDAYLAQRSGDEAAFTPDDYARYVDGKPRYDGVRSFLASHCIELPEGDPEDAPDRETICGLGNRKNALFLDLVEAEGVNVYADTVEQVRRWRRRGLKTAVISSSRNCAYLLEAAGLTSLFDVRVDGVVSEQLGLAGKPAPDIFWQAAQALGIAPARLVVVEDALAGVEAGQAGGFGLVVGVERNGRGTDLLAHGADRVVRDLRELQDLPIDTSPQPRSALDHFSEIAAQLQGHPLALFTDYDGTLTPIVARPEDAQLSAGMRSHLQALAQIATVAVISGRDLEDVQAKVDLPNLYYAGSHGFDIAGPQVSQQQPAAQAALPDLEAAQTQLNNQIQSLAGVRVERKRFAIAIHYRQASEEAAQQLPAIVQSLSRQYPSLRCRRGKKIFELQPDIPWDKGQAIGWLLKQLPVAADPPIPLYLGDDTTDEDAFQALNQADGPSITIHVGPASDPTAATYVLPDPAAVEAFFQALISLDLLP